MFELLGGKTIIISDWNDNKYIFDEVTYINLTHPTKENFVSVRGMYKSQEVEFYGSYDDINEFTLL